MGENDSLSPPSPEPVTDWRASLSPELQGDKTLEQYKSLEELAKGHIETKKLVGNAIRIPGEGAKPEEIKVFHGKLGVPETPEKYLEAGVKLPEVPPESGVAWDQQEVQTFFKLAHAEGYTPKQTQTALNAFAAYMLRFNDKTRNLMAQADTEELRLATQELEKTWGPKDGPQWKHNQALAEHAIQRLLDGQPPAVIQRIVEQANDPLLAQAWAAIGDGLLEHGFLDTAEIAVGQSVEDVEQQIEAMRTQILKVTEGSPEHARLMDEYSALWTMRARLSAATS